MKKEKGFAIFIAIGITGTLLLVSTAIVTVALKEARLAASGRDSQYAFYAADTGLECALYWDVKSLTTGYSAFATSSPGSTIECNRDSSNSSNRWNVGGDPNRTIHSFTMTFLPEPYCARVVVTKGPTGTTLIESYGYNTCDLSNTRRVERAVRASY